MLHVKFFAAMHTRALRWKRLDGRIVLAGATGFTCEELVDLIDAPATWEEFGEWSADL